MSEKLVVAAGKPYGGEIIWRVACGQAVVFPSWLGGRAQINFISLGEAHAFVKASNCMRCVCLEVMGDNEACPVHGTDGGARVECIARSVADGVQ